MMGYLAWLEAIHKISGPRVANREALVFHTKMIFIFETTQIYPYRVSILLAHIWLTQ